MNLDGLLRRLLETPNDYLLEPRVERDSGFEGDLHVDALASDTLRALGGEPLDPDEARTLRKAGKKGAGGLRLVSIACWLLHHPAFLERGDLAGAARSLLLGGLDRLAGAVRAEDCATDPDRREELARVVLRHLGLVPEGESEAVAADRWKALDSVERLALARATAAAEKRAREIRDAAARAAAEAASSYGRE